MVLKQLAKELVVRSLAKTGAGANLYHQLSNPIAFVLPRTGAGSVRHFLRQHRDQRVSTPDTALVVPIGTHFL
jgi:hypothetical protein